MNLCEKFQLPPHAAAGDLMKIDATIRRIVGAVKFFLGRFEVSLCALVMPHSPQWAPEQGGPAARP